MRINKSLVRILIGLSLGSIITLVSTVVYTSPNNAPQASQGGAPDMGGTDSSTGGEYSPESREYHLKAAFLRYVAKFVEWPASALTSGNINICILGLIPSFEAINSINGKVVNDHTIAVSKISEVKEAPGHCQILFVTKTEQDNIPKIIKAVENLPILAFGDMEHFAEQGGDMNFYVLNNRLAIMINPPAVEKSQLKISERMLKVVTVVPPIDQSNKPKLQ
ncbi:MAG: hypothetical protein BGO43_01510 [Gammaproteobacteria bacterium 39-13]|nr:YfiR family protein [Gammaproteobacteria bacterium]OJV85976.1 MAG: hypothetical protein BGO43_01510 [Gammaproteobacteria bacterium 39-13]